MNETTGPFPRERIKQLFVEILELPSDQRAAFIEARSAGDAKLRDELESLLMADVCAGEFLGEPTAGGAAVAVAERTGQVPRQQIGPYKLLQVIGEGGFGTVYLAEQQHPVRRRVALKLIKLGMDTHEIIARFDAERQALAMMDHPGIARVFDAGATDAGRPYFVMELVRGVPMTEYCDRQKLDIRQRLRLFADVCGAVQHAHTKGVIHRDLKPSNILVSTQDDRAAPKIIDFGIAKATQSRLTDKTLFTEYHQFIGSPQYMSPEQSEGSLDIDTRSDVYSLGAMLYELLTGTTPIEAQELKSKTHAQIQKAIREVDPPKPSTRLSLMKQTICDVADARAVGAAGLGTLVRGELDWICMKSMEKDRARRYETAAALALDVQHFLNYEPISAARPSRTYLLRKFVRRNRTLVGASAVILVVLLASMIATSLALLGQARQRAIAQRERAVAEAVAQFQTDMFTFADPARALGEKVTVLEAMQRAIAKLNAGGLNGQPLVEAGVRHTIGLTLRSLGQMDEAATALRRAIELRRANLPHADARIAESLSDLGLVLREQGKRDEAETLLREALSLRQQLFPADSHEVASSLNNLALVLHDRAQYDRALPLYREALAKYKIVYGERHQMVAQVAVNLAAAECAYGNPQEAETHMREALAIDRALLPPNHPIVSNVLTNLSAVLAQNGKADEAISCAREALAIERIVLPEGHLSLGLSLNNLAALLDQSGRDEEALPLFREALEIRRETLPPSHPDIAATLNNMGSLLHDLHRNAEAEQAYREAMNIQQRGLPPGHPDLAWTYNQLAVLYHKQGRLDEAEPLFRDSLKVRLASLPAGHPDIATGQVNLATLLHAQGKFAETEQLCRDAIQISSAKIAADHWHVGRVRLLLGQALTGLDRFAEAEAELLLAEQILTRAPALQASRHHQAIGALIDLYGRWDKSGRSANHASHLNQWKQRQAATRPTTKSTTP